MIERSRSVKDVKNTPLTWDGFALEDVVTLDLVHQNQHERDRLQGRVGQSSKVLTRHDFPSVHNRCVSTMEESVGAGRGREVCSTTHECGRDRGWYDVVQSGNRVCESGMTGFEF